MNDTKVIEAMLKLQGVYEVKLQGTKLVSCSTSLSDLRIPDGITELADGCLSGQNNLLHINLSDSIEVIGYAPFSNCQNLLSISCSPKLQKFEENMKYANNAEVKYVSRSRKI